MTLCLEMPSKVVPGLALVAVVLRDDHIVCSLVKLSYLVGIQPLTLIERIIICLYWRLVRLLILNASRSDSTSSQNWQYMLPISFGLIILSGAAHLIRPGRL